MEPETVRTGGRSGSRTDVPGYMSARKMRIAMLDCHQFDKMIPDFLEDRLDNQKLDEFLTHMDHCDECREELSIQFLVSAGMPKLETGETFHLQKELTAAVTQARTRLHRRVMLEFYAYGLEILSLAAAAGVVVFAAFNM